MCGNNVHQSFIQQVLFPIQIPIIIHKTKSQPITIFLNKLSGFSTFQGIYNKIQHRFPFAFKIFTIPIKCPIIARTITNKMSPPHISTIILYSTIKILNFQQINR